MTKGSNLPHSSAEVNRKFENSRDIKVGFLHSTEPERESFYVKWSQFVKNQ
jgi:hypothetical protein